MKTIIKSIFPVLGAAALLAACDENSWNDKLDGFETPQPGSAVQTMTYTLTPADYTKIATKAPYTTGADDETLAALAAIGASDAFATEAEALEIIPKFLRDSTNNFFALANGSAIKVTYNVTANLPAELVALRSNVTTYTVTTDDYKSAWGSDEDYIDAYAPDAPASRGIPSALRANYPDAKAGDYVVVNYNEATENPIFGTIGGGGDEPGFELTEQLNDIALDDQVEVNGVVTAVDKRGFVLTDLGGSILCYQGSGYDPESVAVGDYVTISGEITSYGTAFQLDLTQCEYSVVGAGSYTFPSPKGYTYDMVCEAVKRTGNYTAEYVSIVAKAKISGNYINFEFAEGTDAQGSGYQVPDDIKAQLADGVEYRVCGYFVSVSSGKYFNIVITSLESMTNVSTASVASVPTATTKAAIYAFNGTSWSVPANTIVLQPSDYTAMGQTYGNLSGNLPGQLLPIYLKQTYPYAAADDNIIVAYKYYASGVNSIDAKSYTFDGTNWIEDKGATTAQFVKQSGFWMYNPSVVITLPYARNTDPSYTYYMACVNWVFDNVGKEMGGTSLASSPFIDYRGNAEFYSGASAYYGNVDVRATTAVNNAPEGYEGYDGLTPDEITLLVKKRFATQTMPGALSAIHPDATPIDGMDVTYTVNFTVYDGAATEAQIVFVVSGAGQFKYQSSTNFIADGEDADW